VSIGQGYTHHLPAANHLNDEQQSAASGLKAQAIGDWNDQSDAAWVS
jgi:hypothetical protein